MESVDEIYKKLDATLRKASISQIGGSRPPENIITSQLGGNGVGLEGEALPRHKGKDMFCLLQVNVSELPYIPPELEGTEFLIVFFNRDEIPSDKPHGDGFFKERKKWFILVFFYRLVSRKQANLYINLCMSF